MRLTRIFALQIHNMGPTSSLSIHTLSVRSLNSGEIHFRDFSGKKILVVNVASECGYTKQYQQLQELYEHFGSKIAVVGCPCNDFGQQEPGNPEEIATFCSRNYGVTFPITEKMAILGENPHPLYAFLTKKANNGVLDSTVSWNFQKYLLDENGLLLACFPSSCDPLSESILAHLTE